MTAALFGALLSLAITTALSHVLRAPYSRLFDRVGHHFRWTESGPEPTSRFFWRMGAGLIWLLCWAGLYLIVVLPLLRRGLL